MSDDKTKAGRDREFVAGGEEYEVRYFAQKHGISVEQAERLIEQHGNGREKLDEAARALKS
ncbi:DUF3606 domain-containing protein [Novosphingobium sp. JCM 18896]|uniref:DUF3606 domain-containing protein n=1 Tax=Novosphingobium sp. JCM 18896 TaxID=2989731 RepID=UPI002222A34A|nr:DUF3606 domain-containing protein [Novosphingobium sp. JCM 18896]MCW1432200.1 DUF3606 domain-containing protein [Novosphingobium sp. JCM 18896]